MCNVQKKSSQGMYLSDTHYVDLLNMKKLNVKKIYL